MGIRASGYEEVVSYCLRWTTVRTILARALQYFSSILRRSLTVTYRAAMCGLFPISAISPADFRRELWIMVKHSLWEGYASTKMMKPLAFGKVFRKTHLISWFCRVRLTFPPALTMRFVKDGHEGDISEVSLAVISELIPVCSTVSLLSQVLLLTTTSWWLRGLLLGFVLWLSCGVVAHVGRCGCEAS